MSPSRGRRSCLRGSRFFVILWLFTVAVTAKRRRASDSILDLTTRSGVDDNLDSLDLRGLITERLPESTPLKLLHYVAPKIPAIKHSPDVALRIQSARSDLDSGVAACLLGAIGYSCELVPREDRTSVTRELLQDRRLEQLVECLLCGLDVPKRMAEYTSSELDHVNIDEVLDVARFDEGLSIRDSCRAAWGLSILGAHQAEYLGGEKVEDILIALSLRIRELLLARLQLLRHDDLYNINQSSEAMQTVEERLSEVSEELAEDASLALWTFACVRACTGVSSKAMNNICYTILCQEPGELRKRAQEEAEMAPPEDQLGSNDVVDRLALAEEDTKGPDNADVALDLEEYQLQAVDGIAPEATTCLLDWLSPLEAVDTIWSLALHGHESRVSDGDSRSRAQALCEILSDRLLSWLESERHETLEAAAVAQDHGKESMDATLADVELKEAHSEEVIEHTTTITFDDGEDGEAEAEVMDASAILATERGDSDAETVPDMAIDDVEHSEEEASDEAFHERGEHVQVEVAVPEALFSSHDLCSIAWSLTELDDPLKDCVNEIVVDVLEARGMSTIRGLGGGDLSNLGWAIARAIQEYSDAPSVESSPVLVTEWITEDVLKETGDFIGSPFEAADKLLDRFQPPELSRFLWSIAVSLGSCRGRHLVTEAASELAMLGLLVASRHESLFGPEELARVLWAALELTTFDALASRPLIWEAVGSILCSIEASLGAWENSVSSPGDHQDPSREPGRFVALFGRNRRHQRRLLERYEDGTDESEDMPMPSFLRKTRPKLREIPVDPATLCKLAHGVSDLCCNLPGSKERSVRLLTTALRLMTSRDGRLLSECNLSDVVRLSVAVAQSGPGIRELSGLFTRRLTRMLNTMNSLTMSFRPVDACRLAWSLGEHGVKYSPEHVGEEGAHRRLTLTSVGPFVGVDELDGLVSKDLSRLLQGMVNIGMASADREYMRSLLSTLEKRLPELHSPLLCDILETLGTLDHQLANATDTGDELKCCNLMNSICSHMSPDGQPVEELARWLRVLVSTGFRSDSLVDAIQAELDKYPKPVFAWDGLLADADWVDDMIREPSESLLQRGIRSLFHEDETEVDLRGPILRVTEGLRQASKELVREPNLSESLALGECRELVAQYRRSDTPRFDLEQRRLMSKSVLSRLLP